MKKGESEKTPEITPGMKEVVHIKAPNMQHLALGLRGTAPYVQLRFSEKTQQALLDKMALGERGKNDSKKSPREYEAEYKRSMYRSKDGWRGIPAAAFRNAGISACRVAGFVMTKAKLSIFIEADGLDETDGTPLVRLSGQPERYDAHVRNDNGGADIRVRAMWRNWEVPALRVRYDGDQFSGKDIVNLMMRVGCQVGIGEGRPDSKDSNGMGFGLFELKQ